MCEIMQELADKFAKKQAIETATALLKLGDSIEKVSLVTTLPIEEVIKLAEKLKNES